jgi:hypothetical protein
MTEGDIQFERLKLLFDYTKFHIGVYLTLSGTLVGVLNSRFGALVRSGLIWASLACVSAAGAAGGIIASNIPSFSNESVFEGALIGPWGVKVISAAAWMTIEHLAFWSALLLIALGFILKKSPDPFWKR